MSLKLHIPRNHSIELKYTFEVLLVEFLGLDIDIFISASKNIFIVIGNEKIFLESSFFSFRHLIAKESLPYKIEESTIEIGNVKFSPLSLYKGTIKTKDFNLNIDILGSTFFMLTRWEEYINPVRDAHQRFSAKESIAYKYKFLERPIVNEYVELLWALLLKAGCTQQRKKKEYKLVPTHDVDRPFLFNSPIKNIRALGGFAKRRKWRELKDFVKYFVVKKDPWDTHSLFMDMSERAGVKSHFFFLPKGKAKQDGRYTFDDPRIQKLFKEIKNRGHHIGFHPSYHAYNDKTLFLKEKDQLENAIGQEVISGRQHYLRFSFPETWRIWNATGMKWDSTLSYADCAGFRCGVCYPFPVFDVLNRQILSLFEKPLIAMEGTLIGYEGLDIEMAKSKIDRLKNQVKKYSGEFVFLYHNSAFFEDQYHKISGDLLKKMYD